MIKKQIVNFLKSNGYEIRKIKKTDVYIISFPKSGRTWLNFMLGKLFEQNCELNNLHPDILFNLSLFNNFFPEKIPNITFSHDKNEYFFLPPKKLKFNNKKYKNSKIIFLARNPIDILISSYFEKTKRIKLGNRKDSFWKPFNGSISDYIYEKNGGIDTIISFYNMWYENKTKDFVLITYEDLQKDTEKQLKKIIEFAGIKISDTTNIEHAINYAKFENMQKIEKNTNIKSNKLKPVNKNDTETFKTRKGKIGGYVDYLSEKEIIYLKEKIIKNLHPFFGYNSNL